MMKKNWEMPKTVVQRFEPNEYVAACYQLACRRGSEGNLYGKWYWDGDGERGNVSHSVIGTPDTCGDASANRVITDDGGVFQSVGEFNGQQGWLNGEMTYLMDPDENGIDPGDTIFWYTVSSDGKRRWNHWGYVEQEDPDHPNHS